MFKVISLSNKFDDVKDLVKTEQNVFELFLQNKDLLPENLGYVGIPVADNINKKGISFTQNIINDIEKKFSRFKKIYVCQHIHINKLNFFNNIVFTPHTLNSDKNKVIPHYNSLIENNNYVPLEKRQYKFSFFGAFNSHHTRRVLEHYHSKDTPIIDTGAWHYYKNEKERDEFKNSYIQNLCNTVFSLCPEGTGVSTIRLYETMASGCIPVLFNDVKVPESIEHLCLRTSVDSLLKDIDNFSNIEEKCKKIHEIYWNTLSNERMFEYILNNV